jgi:multidrug efflux system membrane fusion protein
VVFTLPADDLPAFTKAAAAGALAVIALSRDLKTELDNGTVAVLDNQIVQATGTIRLKATFPNANGTLWPGQFVNARVLIETKHNVLTVPSPAVQRGPNGLYAYVVKSDSTVEMRALTLDQLDGGEAIITDGLKPGEEVVMAGQYRLQAGAHVRASNSGVASATPGPTVAPGKTP